jgi:hypothetical protein
MQPDDEFLAHLDGLKDITEWGPKFVRIPTTENGLRSKAGHNLHYFDVLIQDLEAMLAACSTPEELANIRNYQRCLVGWYEHAVFKGSKVRDLEEIRRQVQALRKMYGEGMAGCEIAGHLAGKTKLRFGDKPETYWCACSSSLGSASGLLRYGQFVLKRMKDAFESWRQQRAA